MTMKERIARAIRHSVMFSDDAERLSARQFISNRDDIIALAVLNAMREPAVTPEIIEAVWKNMPGPHDIDIENPEAARGLVVAVLRAFIDAALKD